MNGNGFFKVPYQGHQRPDMRMLCRAEGGLVAYGRWHVLLGILYQSGGRLELNDLTAGYLVDELEFDGLDGLSGFLKTLSEVGCIVPEFLERNVITSRGVCDQLEYLKRAKEAGAKGGRPKKA